MIHTIITAISTILGAIIGWSLNYCSEAERRKIRLCYSLQTAESIDTIEPELRTKYSESDYCIQIYNVGNTPYVLESFYLVHKKKIIVHCVITDNNAIMPYEKYTYRLTEQEYDSILFHCKESNIKKCKVHAYDVGGKKCKGEIDLFLPHIQVGS